MCQFKDINDVFSVQKNPLHMCLILKILIKYFENILKIQNSKFNILKKYSQNIN